MNMRVVSLPTVEKDKKDIKEMVEYSKKGSTVFITVDGKLLVAIDGKLYQVELKRVKI